jgi:polyhydroxyalkanoate synthesis regulator phasin
MHTNKACLKLVTINFNQLPIIMEDLIKKFVYTGVGIASLTAEKLQKSIDKLVDEEKISEKEGKKIVDEFFEKTESKKKDIESQISKITEEVINKFDFSKAKEILDLNKRVKALESKVSQMSRASAQATRVTRKPATPKRAVKKPTSK